VVMRSKESLAAIRVFREGVLALETMHFPDEVRSPAGLSGIVEPELRPQELEMAKSLVLSLSAPFEPAKYQNEYRDAVLQILSAKARGAEPVEVAAEVKPGRVVDLMSALQASIQAAAAERGAPVADAAAAEEAPLSPIIIPGARPDAAAPVAAPEPPSPPPAVIPSPAAAAPAFTPMAPPPGASAPPMVQPTAAAAGGAQPPDRRPTAPHTLPGGRRPLPPTVRRPIPPGSVGQSVWQYRPEL
jgi:DNA end-binding protein Ku